MEKEILSFCTRCHLRFQEMGEVLEYGKFYPGGWVRRDTGEQETRPDTWEIKKALCKKCMVEVNSKIFDEVLTHSN